MQAYKIRIPTREISVQIQLKAFELGYKWFSGAILTNLHSSQLWLEPNGDILQSSTESTWNDTDYTNPEISYQDFLRLEEPTIELTTTEEIIMSEIKLKCVTAPQRAKNISIDREYTGVLINSDDTQVDRWSDAEYFQCVNNSGIEAKYKLSLFERIVPPPPPPPPKLTLDEFKAGLGVLPNRIEIQYNGRNVTVCKSSLSDLSLDSVSCSCGILSSNGLNALYEDLTDREYENLVDIVDEVNVHEIAKIIFKATVEEKIQRASAAMILFSTVDDEIEVCEAMDEICESHGGSVECHNNPNSHNDIKAWLIPKNQ
jgi:hypothetical protein